MNLFNINWFVFSTRRWDWVLGLTLIVNGCTKSPFGDATSGSFVTKNVNQNLFPSPVVTSPHSGTAGSLALMVGEQIVTRLETDLKSSGLTNEQILLVAGEAKKEMRAEASKVVISTLHNWSMAQDHGREFSLMDQNVDLVSKLGSAVARGAVLSLGNDQLKTLPADMKQNTVGFLSTSVISSITVSPQKLSDSGLSQVANNLVSTLITSLPTSGLGGTDLLKSMSKVMEKAVGALDEAGLSAEATGNTVVALTQTGLSGAKEITKGTSLAGESIGIVASSAISGLGATGVSAAQSMSAILSVTTASVKVAMAQEGSQADLVKSIENLTTLTTRAMSNVTAASDNLSGLEKLMGAASQVVAETAAKSPNDLFAKVTAGIVAGSIAAVDAVATKSGSGTTGIVKIMVVTVASQAAQSSASNADMVKMLSEVTGSAVKALANSAFGQDTALRNQAVGSVISGTVTAISKISSQESSFASSAIQGISKAGTQAAADLSKDPEKFAAMSKQIMNTGITTANSLLGGSDSTKLVSLASDMARGAASGLAGQNNTSLSSQVSDLATYAVAAVNESSATNGSSGSITSILTSFATNVGGAISAGLAVGGESAESITAMTSSLSNSIVQSVVVFAPTVDTTSLGQQVTAQTKPGATSAPTVPMEVPAPPLMVIASGAARTPISTVSLALSATNASEMYITNSIGCSVGGIWETFSTTKIWNLAQANSLATVYAKVRNQVGSESPCISASILHDNLGPIGPSVVINAGAPATNTTLVSLALSASEASEMYLTNTPGCSSGSTWETYSSTKTWTLGQTNGTATIYAKFRDQVGNESSCTSASIMHDGSMPTVTSIFINAGAATTSTTAVTLSIAALGATQMFITNNADCSTGGSWTTLNASNPWTLAQTNALATVYVKVRNAFLVESACIPTSIIHDNTAPNPGAIAINSGAGMTASVAVSLSFNANDAISMYITNTAGCNTGGGWENYGTTKSWTLGQTNGVATVYAKFLDSIGNESSCISSSITHDSTAPQTPEVIINNYNSLTSSPSVTLTLNVSDATEMYITHTAGCSTGGVWETYTSTRTWTLPSLNSTNYVYAKFRDLAGNESSCDSDDIIHDDTPPGSIGISINSGATSTQSYNVSLSLSATGASHMYLTNNPGCSGGGSWESFSATKPWVLGQGGGSATVYAKFKDLAGNVSSCTSDSITSTAPAVLAISGGDRFSCAILTGGVLKCWGLNWDGKLGSEDGTMYGNSANSMGANLPAVNLGTGRTVVKVSTGLSHSCAILDNGQVKCWGSCLYGQLGKVCTDFIGDASAEMGDNLTPVDLGTGRTAREISAYGNHTCAVLDNYSLKCWGKNAFGQLGLGDNVDRGDHAGEMGDNLPTVNLGTGRTAKSVAAGVYLTCAILDNDSLKCWGHNGNGPLGRGDTQQIGDQGGQMGDNNTGVNLGTGRTAKAVVAGDRHICVQLDNDTVKCLGENTYGQLGISTNTNIGDSPGEIGDSLNASLVGTGRSVVKIAGGYRNTCVILDNGALKCWGPNGDGQLGLGDTALRGNAPGQMGDNLPTIDLGIGRTAINATVGSNHVCAVLDHGGVKCWGYGFFGTLGQSNTADVGKIPNQMGDYLLPIDL